MNTQKIEQAVKMFLEAIGEDVHREGLEETPLRVSRMCAEIFQGYGKDAACELKKTFSESYDEIILLKDIPFYSVCEHHLLPFAGKAHIAYIPANNKVVGLSKIVRVLSLLSQRLQIQERLTNQIADLIAEKLQPKGVLVVIEAEHMCMVMRGIKKPGTLVTTSALRGAFKKNAKTRQEALSLIAKLSINN
ncbi:MAG: GTP cyclohydrolase I FolE [Candidatus Omnitrophica bacterium]|nr:GTP cyclohydrolase I FolE [Candidatus Omnitrophota bacterium]